MPRMREAIRSGWKYSSWSSRSPTEASLIGLPVTALTESAAPPRASPSSFVRTMPSKATRSANASATRTASWPVIESSTRSTLVGRVASRTATSSSVSSSWTIFTTCWPGVTLFSTSWPSARSRTFATKSLTTSKLTSASSSASLTSRIAREIASSSRRPRLRRSPSAPWSRPESVSNTRAGYSEAVKNRLRRFVKLWIDLFDRHELLDHASAIAFQVLKSVIPLTLLGLAILGAGGQQHVWRKTIAPAIKGHLQPATSHAINVGVEKIFSTDSTGLIVFAAFLSLWYISGEVRAVMGAVNQIYETDDKRSWPLRYAISFGLAACIGLGVIGALL